MVFEESTLAWSDANQGPAVIVVTVVAMTLSTTLMVFRFISRRMVGSAFSKWDWSNAVLLLGYAGALMTSICGLLGWSSTCPSGRPSANQEQTATNRGFGRDLAFVVAHGNLESLLLVNFVSEQSYLVGITMIKLSILLFYRRIFTLHKHIVAIYVFMGIAAGWLVVFEITCLTTCTLVSNWWKDLLSCRNPHADFIASAASNTTIDLGILCIPIWAISQLDLERSQKMSAAALFLTGGLVVFASIGRLAALIQTDLVNITYDYVPAATWSIVEVNLAVVSACLPFLQPLGLWFWAGVKSHISTHSRRSSYRTSSSPKEHTVMSAEKVPDERGSQLEAMKRVSPNADEEDSVVQKDIEADGRSPLKGLEGAYIKVERYVPTEIGTSSRG